MREPAAKSPAALTRPGGRREVKAMSSHRLLASFFGSRVVRPLSLLLGLSLLLAAGCRRPAPGGNPKVPAGAKSSGGAHAVLETERGAIEVELLPAAAPMAVENFRLLAEHGYYNGLTFHRVESGFVIQGGDPKGNGSGGPGWSIPNEKNGPLKHNRGAVAMANAGRDTAGSQFYVVIGKPAPSLDEKEADGMSKYTIFGQVVNGQDAAERIQIGDKMTKVTVQE